ncbi:cytochrome P450 [Peniophora sp. CONT]|nr:cytochrome P450 [Peniophora sp. CONT]
MGSICSSPLTIASALIAIFVASRFAKVWADEKAVGNLPGPRMVVSPANILNAILPTSRFNLGLLWSWIRRGTVYERYGTQTISVIGWLHGAPRVYTQSKEVADYVISNKGVFVKPVEASSFVTIPFGPNLLGSEGEEWKRHRRIIQPAFNKETYKHVWEESFRLFDEMSEQEGWDDKNEVLIEPMNRLTSRFTLLMITRCGFGHHLTWKKETVEKDEMELSDALDWVGLSAIAQLALPRWAFKLPVSWIRKSDQSYKATKAYLAELIASRKETLKTNAGTHDLQPDVFTRMVDASIKEGKGSFNDAELAGNTFLLLFAGHDTTAHALDAALGFLAIYPAIQQELYEEIASVCSSDAFWPFEIVSKLQKTEAAIVEAARMYPAALQMYRSAAEDVVLPIYEPHINGGVLPLRKGSVVCVDLIGLHYNPRYFPEPDEFRPSRWYGKNESEYTVFSWGYRACIGRKFALTESVCFLAKLLRTWKVEPILKRGETIAQWRRRAMYVRMTLAVGVSDVPLRLVRRQ